MTNYLRLAPVTVSRGLTGPQDYGLLQIDLGEVELSGCEPLEVLADPC